MRLTSKILKEAQDNNFILYVDMDGVLVDFAKGYYDLTGEQLTGWKHITDWAHVDSSPDFWAKLEWMPDGKVLWNYISQYKPHILSSPSKSTTAEKQKIVWLQRLKPDVSEIIFVQKEDKQKYAAPHHILIDDYKDNVSQWSDKGGIGILHTSALNTISQLKELGL